MPHYRPLAVLLSLAAPVALLSATTCGGEDSSITPSGASAAVSGSGGATTVSSSSTGTMSSSSSNSSAGGGGSGTGGIGGAGGLGGAGGAVVDAGSDVLDLPDVLPDFPPEELEPTVAVDGIPSPLGDVYVDQGATPLDQGFRSLMAFRIRDQGLLEAAIDDIYDPLSPQFRQYMSVDSWMEAHAPSPLDVQIVKLWIESEGMTVARVASNRLLFEFTGTAQQFNETFQTELHTFLRENPQQGNPPIPVYGTLGPLTVPVFVADRTYGIITADLPASTNDLPGEAGAIVNSPPANIQSARTIAQIAHAYDLDDLYAQGYNGAGVKLGVVVGATFKFKDLQSFWQSLGVNRADPQVVVTMEPVATRYLETTIDTEWSGAMAPAADLIVYEGPDSRNTSMVYTFNEAIGLGVADVLTDSFAHREDSEPPPVRAQYGYSSMMAAALGITVCAATGDSGQTDTPSSSPYVTGVGGTELSLDGAGNVIGETAWPGSGSGPTVGSTFPIPWWQVGIVLGSNGKRAVADVAVNASPGSPFWVYYLADWKGNYGGTSFASPVFAGMIAVVNSYRAANGLPRVGFLNSILYQDAIVQSTFRDVVSGTTTQGYSAGPGWDYPTGWGAPSATGLATTLP